MQQIGWQMPQVAKEEEEEFYTMIHKPILAQEAGFIEMRWESKNVPVGCAQCC